MPTQVHDPHQFAVAYNLIRAAIGRDHDDGPLFHHAVWVEATPTHTTLHTSNIDCYIRAAIPCTQPGGTWRSVVIDTRQKLPMLTRAARTTSTIRSLWAEYEETLQNTLTDQNIKFELVGVTTRGKVDQQAAVLQRRDTDVDWPHEIVGIDRAHTPAPVTGIGVRANMVALLGSILKILGTGNPPVPPVIDIPLDGKAGVFRFEHAGINVTGVVHCPISAPVAPLPVGPWTPATV